MKKFIYTFICALLSLTIYAQSTITGTILDTDTSEPLIGASVYLKGTNTGTVTDLKGAFSLTTDKTGNSTIVASYVGYLATEKNVNLNGGDMAIGSLMLSNDAVG